MNKYAPANDAGFKPYTVTKSGWGKSRVKVVYATNATEAKWRAFGRMGVGEYITDVHRTRTEELETGA